MNMTKPERAKIAVRYLAKKHGKSQQEIGEMLGYKNKASFSALLNGKSAYFSDSIPARIAALDPALNIEFLRGTSDELLLPDYEQPEMPETYGLRKPAAQEAPAATIPPGSIIIPPELAKMFTALSATIQSQQETIRMLVAERGDNAKVG